jgi:sialic acid synthase SpsE/mannose-6-phosphate isomerase-like protein (cupin superfamily)
MDHTFPNPLFVFEMANNHMGDVKHGLRMINEFAEAKKCYDYKFAFKFQLREIDTFIHPSYKDRMDLKYIRRFSETRLSNEQFQELKDEAGKHGFISICTGFDEKSIDLIEKMEFDIIKIASCSLTDWHLLERIALTNKPIIASTAGSSLSDIDNVVSFLQHRQKPLALLHCVGEYPTQIDHLQLNQIDLFNKRYPDITIGYSTHEDPDNMDSIKIAIAKGAKIFEKHVAVQTNEYPKNAYSATPDQISQWLKSAHNALAMCGVVGERAKFSNKELDDLRQFKRGVFASKNIGKTNVINTSDIFYAFPNQNNQLLANDISKYTEYILRRDIKINEPILSTDVERIEKREKVYAIVQSIKKILKEGNVIFPGKANLEISHHYGIDQFMEYGSTMITVVNREYCKKLIIMLPGQKHPEQYHKKKEETFVILYGKIQILLDGKTSEYGVGDVVTVNPGIKHAFSTSTGTIIEEISSTHFIDDSYYTDASIMQNKQRKTLLSHWID